MIADIATGETDVADVLFLIAAVAALLAAWNAWPQQKVDGMLGWVAVSLLSVGWLLQ